MASIMDRCPCAGSHIAADRAEEAAEAARETARGVAEARDLAADALRIAREAELIRDMTVSAHQLPPGEAPTASYERVPNHMAFGLPTPRDGEKGEKGDPFQITGALASVDALPQPGRTGEAYLIQGNLWVWNDRDSAWVDSGPLAPHVGENGNWWIGEVDTGIRAEPEPPQPAREYFLVQI